MNGDGYSDVIIGATGYDDGELDEGIALVFHGSASGIADGSPATADAVLEQDDPGAALGSSVAGAGDVNGDGYADVVVGAPSFTGSITDEGATFVYYGSASGLTAPAHQITGANISSRFGTSVASAGDVNGDGHADVIVGGSRFAQGGVEFGRAFIFLGGATGIVEVLAKDAATELAGDQADASDASAPPGCAAVSWRCVAHSARARWRARQTSATA